MIILICTLGSNCAPYSGKRSKHTKLHFAVCSLGALYVTGSIYYRINSSVFTIMYCRRVFWTICDCLWINLLRVSTAFSRTTFIYRLLVQFMLIVMVFLKSFYASYSSKVMSTRTRSFRIIRFREKRGLTYAAIAPHSHHVYNSDGILDRSWRHYTT